MQYPRWSAGQESGRLAIKLRGEDEIRPSLGLSDVVRSGMSAAWGQEKRKIIIDQDAAGPGGTDQQSILLLIQSPQTEVLGVTVVTGDAWLKSEVAHTLRMLELIGRTDIPVVPGAEYPLVRTKDETELWQQRYGSVSLAGRVDSEVLSSAGSIGRNARRQAHHQGRGRRCRAFPDAHGAQVSSRGHDLRGRPHDQPGSRHLN